MEILQQIFMALIGFGGGVAVAGGTFELISALGVIPRITQRLGMTGRIYTAETMTVLGGTIGSIFTVYHLSLPVGIPGLIIYGLFAGIFIGGLAMGLAESLRVIPILCQRINFRMGIAVLILVLAVGKGLGTFLQFCVWHMN